MRIWLDDQLPPDDMEWHNFDAWLFHAEDVLALVRAGLATSIDFDHDLGVDRMTGYDLAAEIERLAFEGKIDKIGWSIHSMNPVGASRIRAAMWKADEWWITPETEKSGHPRCRCAMVPALARVAREKGYDLGNR